MYKGFLFSEQQGIRFNYWPYCPVKGEMCTVVCLIQELRNSSSFLSFLFECLFSTLPLLSLLMLLLYQLLTQLIIYNFLTAFVISEPLFSLCIVGFFLLIVLSCFLFS